MKNFSAGFCPIIQGDCRRDCQWCDVVTHLEEDGASQELVCAVMGLYASMLDLDADGWLIDD